MSIGRLYSRTCTHGADHRVEPPDDWPQDFYIADAQYEYKDQFVASENCSGTVRTCAPLAVTASFAGARQEAGVAAGQGRLLKLFIAMPPPPWLVW